MFSHVLALALVAATSAPSVDDPDTSVKSVHVSYADLDLTTPAGRAQLERRLKRATNAVCTLDFSSDRLAFAQVGRCKAAAETAWRALASRAEETALRRRDEEVRLAERR